MTACAGQEINTQQRLPHIGNGKLFAYRQPQPFSGELCTSLPPLPDYILTGIARSRWGEDEDINRLGYGPAYGGYPRFRNNFDSCHPVSEDPDYLKHEGYMYPKPLHQDLSVLRHPTSNTGRRVPRDSKCELFPRNNTSRLQDGQHVLGESTRGAIEENINRLYRTTRYDNMFQDTSNFMIAKKLRDAQYLAAKDPEYIETPTCSRVHNHPDPCHHCWYGGCNKDFEAKLAEFHSKLYSSVETGCIGGKMAEMSSAKHGNLGQIHKNHYNMINDPRHLDEQVDICGCLNNTCSVCMEKKAGIYSQSNLIQEQTENPKTNEKENYIHQRGSQAVNKDNFGPWQDAVKENGFAEEQLIFSNIYQFKLPSSAHCQSTQNEYASDSITLHKGVTFKPLSVDQWKLLCRAQNVPNKVQGAHNHNAQSSIAFLPPTLKQTTRNSWTYRDKNNLRMPCIADVIGSSRKTDAHKRYHLEHPEPIPDLRDHRRYARRVRFNGYSSSVFR